MGFELASTVRTVAVLLDTPPICDPELYVRSSNVPTKDVAFGMLLTNETFWAFVKVIVLLPVLPVMPVTVTNVVPPGFLILKVCVIDAPEITDQLKVTDTVASSAVTVFTLFNTDPPSVLIVTVAEVP